MINELNISLIATGNQKAFRHIMDMYADELFLFAKGFIKDREVAEEIVSDVFVKIWNNRLEIDKIKNLKSYLFISVKNGCLSYLRKIKNGKIISIDQFQDFNFLPVQGPESELIDKEKIEEIYKAIKKLPPKCQLAFTLAKINNLRHREIAEVMEVSEKTVNNHIVSAVKKICSILKVSKKSTGSRSPLKQASLF
jgi:RNA polymerase sigma-70 factor (family 1)